MKWCIAIFGGLISRVKVCQSNSFISSKVTGQVTSFPPSSPFKPPGGIGGVMAMVLSWRLVLHDLSLDSARSSVCILVS